MKKNSSGIVWGILLILGGIAIGGKVLNWFAFDLFFSGWWTLFIIIPSAVRFFTERGERISALKGLFLGILLLMAAQGFIEFQMFIPLMIAALLILKGIKMLQMDKSKNQQRQEQSAQRRQNSQRQQYRQNRSQGQDYMDAAQYHYEEEYDYGFHDEFFEEDPKEEEQNFEWNQYADRQQYRREYNREQSGRCVCTSVLSGKEISYSREVFDGAMLSCVLGAIDLDLTDAVMYQDVVIEGIAILGSIDIIVPKDVRVVVKGTPILGGIDNHVKRDAPPPLGAITIFINTTCILGGIDIQSKKK